MYHESYDIKAALQALPAVTYDPADHKNATGDNSTIDTVFIDEEALHTALFPVEQTRTLMQHIGEHSTHENWNIIKETYAQVFSKASDVPLESIEINIIENRHTEQEGITLPRKVAEAIGMNIVEQGKEAPAERPENDKIKAAHALSDGKGVESSLFELGPEGIPYV